MLDIEELVPGQVIEPSATSAWIEPNGRFHFVEDCSHFLTALTLGDETGGRQLERSGWVHFSFTGVHHNLELTQAQIDTLFDTLMAFENGPIFSQARLTPDYIRVLRFALGL